MLGLLVAFKQSRSTTRRCSSCCDARTDLSDHGTLPAHFSLKTCLVFTSVAIDRRKLEDLMRKPRFAAGSSGSTLSYYRRDVNGSTVARRLGSESRSCGNFEIRSFLGVQSPLLSAHIEPTARHKRRLRLLANLYTVASTSRSDGNPSHIVLR
ncbi:hypothetical protein GY45DRAFT_813725 [Cubamyces sp. BRFM 1775]|nr:hypothetical protein GY45DRAFT_813725 [Cubamyces sp. BRFM 1775]